MIEIYRSDNINYEFNGDITLPDATVKGKIELNGVCEIELEQGYDSVSRWKYIVQDGIIACPTPWSKKQLFRIYNVVKDINGITAYARHIYFDLADYVLLNVKTESKTGQEALNCILDNTPFTGHSNISSVNTSDYIRKNIIEAINSSDVNSFINKWGGEVYLDNYNITINNNIGADLGVRVEFGYNLNEIEQDINIDDVVTRIIPVGADGIMLEGTAPWIDSSNINKYANVKQKVITFDDVKVKENKDDNEGFATLADARKELINRCNKLYEEGLDKPNVNYKVDMVSLADTTAYKDYKILEEVNLGDTIYCKHAGLDIDISTRCISLEWELINDKVSYTNIELGNFRENYFDKQSDITNRVDKIMNTNGNVMAECIQGIIDATKSKFRALKDVAQTQHVRAMLFEDLDSNSPTFGAMCIGTMGFEIASQRNSDNTDWDWRTFGSGRGFVADYITAGVLKTITIESNDGSLSMDLNNGVMKLNGSTIWTGHNGSYAMVDGEGIQFYDGVTKRKTFNLFYSTQVTLPAFSGSGNGATNTIVQLPSQFRNKSIQVFTSITSMKSNGVPGTLGVIGSCDVSGAVADYTNATVQVAGQLNVHSLTDNIDYSRNQDMIITLTAIA